MGSLEKFSELCLADWPAISNIFIYMNEELFIIDKKNIFRQIFFFVIRRGAKCK